MGRVQSNPSKAECGTLLHNAPCFHRPAAGHASKQSFHRPAAGEALFTAEKDPKRLAPGARRCGSRSEEHTSELQSLMRISYAFFCVKKKHTLIYVTQSLTSFSNMLHL